MKTPCFSTWFPLPLAAPFQTHHFCQEKQYRMMIVLHWGISCRHISQQYRHARTIFHILATFVKIKYDQQVSFSGKCSNKSRYQACFCHDYRQFIMALSKIDTGCSWTWECGWNIKMTSLMCLLICFAFVLFCLCKEGLIWMLICSSVSRGALRT